MMQQYNPKIFIYSILVVVAAFFIAICSHGCGNTGTYAPVVNTALEAFINIAEKHGLDPDKLPATCETEWNPQTKKLYVLCEVDGN